MERFFPSVFPSVLSLSLSHTHVFYLFFSECCFTTTQSGFVENYPHAQFNINADENKCRSCPESRPDTCGLHHQSPIDLQRDRGELLPDGTHGENEKECPDWHYMQTRDDTCSFDDLKGNFEIDRFALQLNIPQTENGEIACEEGGQRMYPRLDYSKGFPHWWHMQRLDIVVPSNHVQEGIQYAAEVVLAHFYEVEHYKNQVRIGLVVRCGIDGFVLE